METKEKKKEPELNKKDVESFLKLLSFAYKLGYRRVIHPFGVLFQKGTVGFNPQAIWVWTPEMVEGTDKVRCKWVKVLEYKGLYLDFENKIKELETK